MTHRRGRGKLWIRGLALACVAGAVLGLGHAADDPGAIATAAWPARAPVAGHDGAMGAIRMIEAPGGLSGLRTGGPWAMLPAPADLEDARALLPELDAQHAGKVEFERDGSFVFRAARPAAKKGAEQPAAAGPLRFAFVSGRPGKADGDPLKIERTWFTYYDPKGERPRGLALLMPGLLGTPEPILELFVTKLREQGWGVVRMMSQPSRFTERRVFKVDLANLVEAAGVMASELDQRVAECAYAAQGAMAYVAAQRPALAALPRVAVGMSGGAMTLPSVVAREPGAYAAAVIIAGGCDFFSINEESNYKLLIQAIDFAWSPGQPTDEQRKKLDELYLERAKLDSYHTALALKGKPMLMIHGDHDGAVPARLGDLLWERLGKPERWVETAGHEEVFMKLPGQVDRIMDWLAGAAGKAAQAEPARREGATQPEPAGR